MDKQNSMYDFLIEHCDWISATNEDISYEEMLIELDKNGVVFTEKRSYDNKYVVITKPYNNFIDYMVANDSTVRITRIDIKFDTPIDYMELVTKHIKDWNPHSCIGHKIADTEDKFRYETIYFNSRQSDLFCRLYDKQLELQLQNPLTRLEYELKGYIAKVFSFRLCNFGIDDAVGYVLNLIQDFNYHKNLDCVVKIYDYGKFEPVPWKILEDCEYNIKFRRFIHQYKDSIVGYCNHYGLDGGQLYDLCFGVIDIDKVLKVV